MRLATLGAALFAATTAMACSDSSSPNVTFPAAKDPATAAKVAVDRFSATAGRLFVRASNAALPGPNQPIDMDTGPFITTGYGPTGQQVKYYNFDVQPTTPAPIFVFYRAGTTTPVSGQLNVIDVLPGDQGYNDFWQVVKVTVPASYVANSITSVDEIRQYNLKLDPTTTIVNCPVVPEGSVARLHLGPATGLTHGWYRGKSVAYFNYDEAPITTTANGAVPLASIYVTFTTNPGQPGGGPASGFKTESGTLQTHNVASVLPGQPGYTPLWTVLVYDNTAFANVNNLPTAGSAAQLGPAGDVNCPIVAVGP